MMALGPVAWSTPRPPWHCRCCCRRPTPTPHRPALTNRRWRRRQSVRCEPSSSSSSEDEAPEPLYCHSDNETSMPGGFENSAMKSSFSLSSLPPSSASLESPEHVRPERPYNSLRKTCRRDPEKDAWRRSWDRKEDTKDVSWDALKQPNYLYLMDSNLIDSCKEAGRDLQYSSSSPSHEWSFEQFCTQFSELNTWLTSIQEAIYSKEENVTDRNLRLSHVEEMHRKTYKRKVFNNQGGRLAARFPELKMEVKWRMTHLNRKWEQLEQRVTPRKQNHPDHLTHAIDLDHELNCLRKWLRLTDRRLQPLSFRVTWTLAELEIKAKEHQVIQREVELHGKIVSSVLKRCERLAEAEAEADTSQPLQSENHQGHPRRFEDSQQAARAARDLQRRWQHLFIRSLEWQCHIENETKQAINKSPEPLVPVESDEGEPVLKHPRLSASPWLYDRNDDDGDCLMADDSAAMVGTQTDVSLASFGLPRSGSGSLEDMNKNFCQADIHRRQSVPSDAARQLFSTPAHLYTSTERTQKNSGVYYYKHPDTESEQDDGVMETDSKNMDESSEEDEWTYTVEGEGGSGTPGFNDESSLCHSTETLASAGASHAPESLLKPVLRKLIEDVDDMVHLSPTRRRQFPPLNLNPASSPKHKVASWMKRTEQAQVESCDDASWEYTTEEEGHSSGDFHASLVTSSAHQSAETLPLLDSPATEKGSPSTPSLDVLKTPENLKMSPVVLRAKGALWQQGTPKRPLSESGLPQLISSDSDLLLSRSESALHQMESTPTHSVKTDSSMQGTLSSSTTVEEMPGHQTQEGSGGGYSTNSLRKRKTKLRRRNLGRKSDSSDGQDPPSPLKAIPAIRQIPTSGTETEEEVDGESKARASRRKHAQPNFRLGPDCGQVTMTCYTKPPLSAESSSYEQAWDSYQEKYNSEAYSEEIADQETTQRLLNFGDDYRNFFDSQSDGSSLGRSKHLSIRRRKHQHSDQESSAMDSDSEAQVLEVKAKLANHLELSESAWTRLSNANFHLVMAPEFEDLIATCKDRKKHLRTFLEQGGKDAESFDFKGLIERWEALELRTEQLQKVRSLQREMAGLRKELADTVRRVDATDCHDFHDRDQLDNMINQIKGEEKSLRERRSQLVEVNTAVHKFFTDSDQEEGGTGTGTGKGLEAARRLKDEVTELYSVWEDANRSVQQKIEGLIEVSSKWATFEAQFVELQDALRTDHNTLRVLDLALHDGQVSKDALASSVIDVAKILSEKRDLTIPSVCSLNGTTPKLLPLPPSTEGSLSDSGISDSGSEQESERERRLSNLRRLARHLEAALSPNSQAITDMARRIEEAEAELRGLQATCLELIGRTSVSMEQTSPSGTTTPTGIHPTVINRMKKGSVSGLSGSGPHSFMELDEDPEDPEPGKGGGGWLWRVVRAALPFQLAILALVCVACLLEPSCCDNMNNLNFSLTPQLRYMRGSPPV